MLCALADDVVGLAGCSSGPNAVVNQDEIPTEQATMSRTTSYSILDDLPTLFGVSHIRASCRLA